MRKKRRRWCEVVLEPVPPTAKKVGEVARGRLPSQHSFHGRRMFVRMHMWRTVEALREAKPEEGPRFQALFEPNRHENSERLQHRIGDLHLAMNAISLEHVAHELVHALVHRVLLVGPDPMDVWDQRRTGDAVFGRDCSFFAGRADEEIAHELGRWVPNAYVWTLNVLRQRGMIRR